MLQQLGRSSSGTGAGIGGGGQESWEPQFVDELFQNLQGDRHQSNFMRAYPGGGSKLDLTDIGKDVATKVVSELLATGEVGEKVATNSKAFTVLMQRSAEERKDFGVDSLRIGFPLIECSDSKSSYLCPLVLWKVKVEMTNGRYTLSRDCDDEVDVNDTLVQFFAVERDITVKNDTTAAKARGWFNDVDIERLVGKLLPEESKERIRKSLESVLDKTGLAKVPTNPGKLGSNRVIWGAILGLFKTANVTVLKDLEAYRRASALSIATEPILSHQSLLFSGLPLDPSQFEAVQALRDRKNLVIIGPPGTGKSQTLAGVLSCVGANGLRTLVVCEKKTALAILQRKLGEMHWDRWDGEQFSTCITNVQEREEVVSKALRNRAELEQTSVEEVQREEGKMVSEIHRLSQELDEEAKKFTKHQQVVNQLVSFNMSAKEAIAFVVEKKLEGFTMLPVPETLDLSEKIFATDHLMMINRCQENIGKEIVDALKLVKLSPVVGGSSFQAMTLIDAANELRSKLELELSNRTAVVARTKQQVLSNLKARCEAWSNQLGDLQEMERQLGEFEMAQIQAFDAPTWFSNLSSFFGSSRSLRCFHSSLQLLRPKFIELCDGQEDRLPTNYKLSNIKRLVKWCSDKKRECEHLLQDVDAESTLDTWQSRQALVPEQARLAFQAQNDRIMDCIKTSFFSTEHALKKFKEQLLKEETKENYCFGELKRILLPFEQEHFSAWRKASDSLACLIDFGLAQDDNLFQELLNSGKALKWGERVKLCILAREVESKCKGLLASDFVLDKLSDCLSQIQANIRSLYCIRQVLKMQQAIEAYEKHSGQKFEQLFNRSSKKVRVNSLREIVKDLTLFTSCFPVIFCTPEVASTLFKARHRYFDLVVVDEASQSLTHDAYAALLKGKKVVIAGDNKQMPPTTLFSSSATSITDLDLVQVEDELDEEFGLETPYETQGEGFGVSRMGRSAGVLANISRNAANAESLLDFATDHSFAFKTIDLAFHYRSLDPVLMGFHCAAIYPNLALCPKSVGNHVGNSDRAIHLVQANGIYKDQANRVEAEKIIKILERMAPDLIAQGNSIAVATFNEVQKKLILRLLKANPMLQKVCKPSNNFFVKNLENLQGDEVDVLIIGTTFGRNANGSFAQRFGRVNFQGLGYRYLNVLFSRAKRKLIIVTSIPEEEFLSAEKMLDDSGVLSGVSMLYGFLAYAKAVSDGDEKRVQAVLREFSMGAVNPRQSLSLSSMSCLENVIFQHLTQKRNALTVDIKLVPDDNVRTLLRGILVQLHDQRHLVIECNAHESYRHSLHRRDVLRKFNYDYYNIWPANWLFDDPRREFEKLRDIIKERRQKSRISTPVTAPLPLLNVENEEMEEESPPPPARSSTSKKPVRRGVIYSPKSQDEHFSVVSEESSVSGSKSPVQAPKFGEPYLVKYGAKKKFIVFHPVSFHKGDARYLVGEGGGKTLKVSVHRCKPLEEFQRKEFSKGKFHDLVEFQRAMELLQGSSSSSMDAESVESPSGSKPSPSTSSSSKRGASEDAQGQSKHKRTKRTPKSRATKPSAHQMELHSDHGDEDVVEEEFSPKPKRRRQRVRLASKSSNTQPSSKPTTMEEEESEDETYQPARTGESSDEDYVPM